jgi:hypothetical protein
MRGLFVGFASESFAGTVGVVVESDVDVVVYADKFVEEEVVADVAFLHAGGLLETGVTVDSSRVLL